MLQLEIAVQGMSTLKLMREEAHTGPWIEIAGHGVARRLRHSDLSAQDAQGTPLPAAIQVRDERIVPSIDASGARFPIAIDPLLGIQQDQVSASAGMAGNLFGNAIAISGDTAGIGAFSTNSGAGAAYVVVRATGGTTWTAQAKLVASDAASNARFGRSVAIFEDKVIVGAPLAASAAFIFVRPSGGTTWNLQSSLTPSMPSASLNFGHYVAISEDTAVIGPASTAAVALYTRPTDGSSMWNLQGTVRAMDNSSLGFALALDGNTLMIQSGPSTSGSATGAVHVFGLGLTNGEPCVTNSQCLISRLCVAKFCGKPDGASCANDTECQNSLCISEVCRIDANLSVLALTSPNTTSGLQPVAVRVKLGNTGPDVASSAALTLGLPMAPGFAASHVTGQGWTCQTAAASIVCTIDAIPVGGAADVTMDVVPPFMQPSFTITANIKSAAHDVNLLNNKRERTISNSAPCLNAACSSDSPDGGSTGWRMATRKVAAASWGRPERPRPGRYSLSPLSVF